MCTPSRPKAQGLGNIEPHGSAWLAGAALILLVLLVTQDSPPQTLSVQVAPPHGSTDESGSTAGGHQPTPLGKLRAAATSYFPDMFNGPKRCAARPVRADVGQPVLDVGV